MLKVLKYKKVLIVIASLIVTAWWFRFDTHCSGSNANYACVSYDRFTGQWILPIKEAMVNYK